MKMNYCNLATEDNFKSHQTNNNRIENKWLQPLAMFEDLQMGKSRKNVL
jgi:hypothetical protein